MWKGFRTEKNSIRTYDPSSTTEGQGHNTQAPYSTTTHQHGCTNAKRKRPYSTSRSKTTTKLTHTSKRKKGLTGAASAMEEGLPQDEDTSHLTTLTSHVNSTPAHTVNNTGTSGCQERTAHAAMEIDSSVNVHIRPAPAAPHLFPVFTRSVSRRGRRMAHGGGSVGMCSRWSGDKCRHCVGSCGYKRPFCSLDVPGGVVCFYFATIVVTGLM